MLALRDTDWMFPTYRESMALVARGIDPVEALTLLRGDWHCGYDPVATRTAPQCTPLATQSLHAAGLAYAARRRGAGHRRAGVRRRRWHQRGRLPRGAELRRRLQGAGRLPRAEQPVRDLRAAGEADCGAVAGATRGVGYGIRSEQVDGNDLGGRARRAPPRGRGRPRGGKGPFLVEAHTYRIEAHTNADDASALPRRRRGRGVGRPRPDPSGWRHTSRDLARWPTRTSAPRGRRPRAFAEQAARRG